MKTFTTLMAICTLLLCTASAGPLVPRESLPLTKGEKAYLVIDNVAVIGDDLIERLTIGGNYIAFMYRNSYDKAVSAQFTIRLYNRYGFLMCEKEVKGVALGNKGDVGADMQFIQPVPMSRLIEKTGINEPAGWGDVHWVVISATNTRENTANKDNALDAPSSRQ
jgi:hypothetical protein